MKKVVYDSGVLIAAERNDRRVWAQHRVRLEAGVIPMVPAAVLAQVSRSPKQLQMRRLLRGCDVVAFDEASAHAAGRLLALTDTRDVVDAAVAQLCSKHQADVVSGDAGDLRRLLSAARAKSSVIDS
jgi:hypothetical protein